ncbi:MAG: P-type conjugative transfer ATPase TrbB [Acidobacteriota bacterium]
MILSAEEERAGRLRATLRGNLGPEILAALDDPDITDIHVNPDGKLFYDTHSQGRRPGGVSLTTDQVTSALNTIAGHLGAELTDEQPMLAGEFPLDGNRIEATVRPVVTGPSFALRKKSSSVYSLAEYVEKGECSETHAAAIRQAIREWRPCLVAGGTGSGKTTLANAILAEVVDANLAGPFTRFVTIEDTYELQCAAENKVPMRSGANAKSDTRACLKAALRYHPDLIIVGEVRDAAAYDLLQAWNTGHKGGVATIHANNANLALRRLDQLAQLANVPTQSFLIAYTGIVVVFVRREGNKRFISEVLAVNGLDRSGEYQLESLA